MTRNAWICLGVGAVAILLAAVGASQNSRGPAPTFRRVTTDGKSFDLKSALKKGPVFVYFVSTTCPVTARATKYYERIARAYRGSGLTVVGVANDNNEGIREWQNTQKVSFPIVPDPQYKIIKAYDIQRSPNSLLIGRDGKIVSRWDGFSAGYLQAASQASARVLCKPVQRIDFSGAPKGVEAG